MTEAPIKLSSGWPAFAVALVAPFLIVGMFILGVRTAEDQGNLTGPVLFVGAVVGALGYILFLLGFAVVNPNEALVIQLFGTYKGSLKEVGFWWGNPFYTKTRVSQRVHTFETGTNVVEEKKDAAGNVTKAASSHRQPAKVNDKDGTPIEIAAVVVWQVVNTAEAVFAVDNFSDFVHVQSEAALRNLASQYPYDSHDDQVHSLRSHTAEVAEKLTEEIQERVQRAGVKIVESRISYLAYASEIAAAMLQRQQAAAIIAARQKIVEGAVGMVEMALDMLKAKEIIDLDGERKAAMVSNLLVVLCGDRNPQPVLNTGTIYQ